MRPEILYPLFASLTSLKGVGPRAADRYRRLCGDHVVDALWHLPIGAVDRRYAPRLKYADKDRVATLTLRVVEHAPPKRKGLPYRIIADDGTDQIAIVYFNTQGDYLGELYPTDRPVVISGLLERFRGGWTMNHPDYVVPTTRLQEIPEIEPVYPLTAGLSGKQLRKTIAAALTALPDLAEWQDPHLLEREKWPRWKDAVRAAHDPSPFLQENAPNLPRRRLAYDELLADQLALAVIRRRHREMAGRPVQGDGALRRDLERTLPFALTSGQRQALVEISEDMAAPKRMLRLLQGDVGAGKTVVALMAMAQALEAGMQAAMMAPTEILARQHAQRLNAFLGPVGLTAHLLIGKSRAQERRDVLEGLADGSVQIVVGTHALLQDEVRFKDLGLAVVDEQHRFGVQQRLQLSDKGKGVDVLVMTATPIPRTLTLTAYGDMDVSRLLDKPKGRQAIDTRLINLTRLEEAIEAVKRQLAKGAQVYWVCPLIEESETSDLAAAVSRADRLRERLGENVVGLVHGRMTAQAKEQTMAAFAQGQLRVLVATTVIEVGVDVPGATIMVIEHAQRFGLAQLHQLRGRVGRGSEKSSCLLLYQEPLGAIAKARLRTLRETEDGFRLAEEDLRLRGPGEMLGTRQSGLPLFRLADLCRDEDLLAVASKDAQAILAQDPTLATPRGKALRVLLYLFQKDAAVKLFRSG